MKKYKFQTLSGDIEFKLLSAEDADSYYHTLLKDNNPHLEEYIFDIITEYKYQTSDLPAGIIPLVVYLCINQSGIVKGKSDFVDLIDEMRLLQEKNNYYSIYSKIISYLPSYKLDELKEKDLNSLMELLIFAEGVAGKHFTDTKKIREVMAKEELQETLPSVPQKKGVKNLTKHDLDAIKNAINYNDNSNMI